MGDSSSIKIPAGYRREHTLYRRSKVGSATGEHVGSDGQRELTQGDVEAARPSIRQR